MNYKNYVIHTQASTKIKIYYLKVGCIQLTQKVSAVNEKKI